MLLLLAARRSSIITQIDALDLYDARERVEIWADVYGLPRQLGINQRRKKDAQITEDDEAKAV